jgi:hypothetical protein
MKTTDSKALKEFYDWVLQIDGKEVVRLCEERLKAHPEMDPFLARDEILLDMHKVEAPRPFGQTQFNS